MYVRLAQRHLPNSRPGKGSLSLIAIEMQERGRIMTRARIFRPPQPHLGAWPPEAPARMGRMAHLYAVRVPNTKCTIKEITANTSSR